MSLTSLVLSRVMQLPPAHTTAVRVERDLRVPMPDGVVLLADRFVARGGEDQPLVLIRSPYGRSGFVAEMWARPFAERGFQVLIQSCRGTHGSGGEFDPFHHERSDGAATLAWIKTQPWFCGVMFTFGQSYLGYTQWALAQAAGPELRAMATQVTSAHIGAMTYGGGAFMLENSLSWTRVVTMQRQRGLGQVRGFIEMMSGRDPLQRVWRGVTPLAQVDELGLGQPVSFFRDWLQNPSPDDAWWQPMDHTRALERIDKPVCMVAGWFDIFAPWQFRDFVALQAAGRDVQLTVGPYAHIDLRINALGIREALVWFRAHLNGVHVGRRAKPVRVYVPGAKVWREFECWPPPANATRWYLQPHGKLAQAPAADSAPDSYLYDPAQPTPAIGGPSLSRRPVVVDNRKLEARADVLVFTSDPLAEDQEVVGEVAAELWVSSSAVSTDFFVRLCEVDTRGASRNVCDNLARVQLRELPQQQGAACVKFTLWPSAHRFKRGHRLRVQVSSGAYPRWSPNPGTGLPLADASAGVQQRQQLFHDPSRPSAIVLPVVAP